MCDRSNRFGAITDCCLQIKSYYIDITLPPYIGINECIRFLILLITREYNERQNSGRRQCNEGWRGCEYVLSQSIIMRYMRECSLPPIDVEIKLKKNH